MTGEVEDMLWPVPLPIPGFSDRELQWRRTDRLMVAAKGGSVAI
jgi:hypothetical protein